MQNFGEISKSCSIQIISLSKTLSVLFSTPRSSAWTTSSTNTSKHLSQMFGTVCAASQSCKYFSLNSEVTNNYSKKQESLLLGVLIQNVTHLFKGNHVQKRQKFPWQRNPLFALVDQLLCTSLWCWVLSGCWCCCPVCDIVLVVSSKQKKTIIAFFFRWWCSMLSWCIQKQTEEL